MAVSRKQPSFAESPEGVDFVSLLQDHQRQMFAFLLAMLPFETDVDDIFQQACLALWRKRSAYDPSRPFLPWAIRFLEITAFKHLRAKVRDRRQVQLSERLLSRIAASRSINDATAEARRAALDACVEQLRPAQRHLLTQRFAGTHSLKEIATAAGVSAASLTMKLQRIRHALLKCVERTMSAGEST